MFSSIILNTSVSIMPNKIDKNIREKLLEMIREMCEGKILGKINGYVISVVDIVDNSVKDGIINDINGSITYSVEYIAVVFIPEKKDVLNVVIHRCSELGIFFRVKELKDVEMIECMIPSSFIKGTFRDDVWTLEDGEVYEIGDEFQASVLNFQIDISNILIFLEI